MRVQLICDDLSRVEDIRRLIAETADVSEVASSSSSARRSLTDSLHLVPDVIVLDLEVRDITALEAIRPLFGAPYQDLQSALTPREHQVFKHLADGKTSKEIAHELRISSKTVDTHRRNLMRKIGVDGLADLVKQAICAGLTTLEPNHSSPGPQALE